MRITDFMDENNTLVTRDKIKNLKLVGARVLFVLCDKDAKAIKSANAIAKVEAKKYNQVSVADMLKAKKVIFCESALNNFTGKKAGK